MRLEDFLQTLQPFEGKKARVFISFNGTEYTVYSNAVDILGESVRESYVDSWYIVGNSTVKVVLKEYYPSAWDMI